MEQRVREKVISYDTPHAQYSNRKKCAFLVPEIGLTSEVLQNVEISLEQSESFPIIPGFQTENVPTSFGAFVPDTIGWSWEVDRRFFFLFKILVLLRLKKNTNGHFKSDQSPRYHAREAAEALAEIFRAPCILSSATPSLETMFRAQSGTIHHISFLLV